MKEDIFDMVMEYAAKNYYIDVEDKIPVFVCSVGGHLFNSINKCSRCDFDPVSPLWAQNGQDFAIDACPLRHSNFPVYTPMSHIADTRIHILMRGQKGSGKSALIQLFLSEGTGLLYNGNAFSQGLGFRTMLGPNSITEAGMFGSVDENGQIVGRPLARELCGGFLGFEEFSSLTDASRKEHSTDMLNQLLTSTDNGRVQKSMRNGWVQYTTRYTMWAGTQPARFELESGLDRRFFVIDIEMSPDKEAEFKKAQHKQSNITREERLALADLNMRIKDWFLKRQLEVNLKPPTSVQFSDEIGDWLNQPTVRSFEADLFRRMCIGYHMMKPEWTGGDLKITMDDRLRLYLDQSLVMRRGVMDSDVKLIKDTFWMKDLPKSTLVKEVSRMVTSGDYTAAKRWIEENLIKRHWYKEYIPNSEGRGRKGVTCRIGFGANEKEKQTWGAKV
tara:strand:- start:434 stop:1768 length:1335 start_codon:yes stop_codon:yes gene_type:complete